VRQLHFRSHPDEIDLADTSPKEACILCVAQERSVEARVSSRDHARAASSIAMVVTQEFVGGIRKNLLTLD